MSIALEDIIDKVICGDAIDVLRQMPDNCVDAVVTDPPYGLEFMGKEWDRGIPRIAFWGEMLRVAKPGAHLLAFGGTRTWHRLAVAIEDAGWEIRDTLMWLYGSGFPKSLDISKAIDKAAGAEREVTGVRTLKGRAAQSTKEKGGTYTAAAPSSAGMVKRVPITAPSTDAAKQWQGWGSALKPAWEPVLLCRKPLSEPTLAANVLRWGCGGLNIDAARIGMQIADREAFLEKRVSWMKTDGKAYPGLMTSPKDEAQAREAATKGRWPANVCLSHIPGIAWCDCDEAEVQGKCDNADIGKSDSPSG